jgi:hypothetical protein
MARETKAGREAREAAELQECFEKVSAGWNVRFADVMVEYATLPGFTVTKSNGGVYLFTPPEELMGYNHHYEVPVVLTFEFFYNGLHAMEDAERAVTRYREEEAAAEYQAQVVRNAIAKLRKEECDLLKSYWSK